MDDDTKLEKLINQCKSNDVDVKIDALTKLQLEFENGIEIIDSEGLINVLKACLRTSNQHLTAATISALPPLLPLIISPTISPGKGQSSASPTSSVSSSGHSMVDAVTLRQALQAFLPAGGVIDRLGDNREKTRDKARETLVILGGFVHRSSGGGSVSAKSRDGRGPETPLMIFERFIREGGLGSKVWKTREQAILTLVHIRRAHSHFPIRPYLPQLVAALEDGDAHVRDCARPSVIELFTGPGVTDAARADLKKEMTKKGVRKTIVDGVLSKLITINTANGGGLPSDGSDNGDVPSTSAAKSTGYIPPSLKLQNQRQTAEATAGPSGVSRTMSTTSAKGASRPASRAAMVEPPTPEGENVDVKPVYITSSKDMEAEFAAMLKPFEGKETEHNWMLREAAILRVRGMLKGDAHVRYNDVFLACLKDGFIQWSLKSLASLRTTVAVNTTSLYSELAINLGPALDPFCDILLTNLLRMAGFTKKIAAQQSQAAVTAILTHTSASPRICFPLFWNSLQEKTVQMRVFVIGHMKTYLEVHGPRSKNAIEASGNLQIVEKSLKKVLADPSPAVRECARTCFWIFNALWHDRGSAIVESLDAIARKQLEKTCPNPESASLVSTAPEKPSKKTSVAAAIAASRAKAKAIAVAPPTLRHQATSSSQISRATSPPEKKEGLPSSPKGVSHSMSPVNRAPTSPPSPRSRITANGNRRPISMISGTSASSRSPPSSTRAESPTPPATDKPMVLRRASSPLATSANRNTALRQAPKATATSPPSSSVKVSPTSRSGTSRTVTVPPRLQEPTTPPPPQDEESLMASPIQIPEDSDSEESMNLMSFSAALSPRQAPPPRKSNSPPQSPSPTSDPVTGASNALSTGSITADPPAPIIEDALRARAEQAESAAERLLELVEPEDDSSHHSSIPTSLLIGRGSTPPPPKAKTAQLPLATPPVTPVNRNTAIMRQAAMFKDSPAYSGTQPSLLDVLREKKHETGWWLKRMKMVEQRIPREGITREEELGGYITSLEQNQASVRTLQRIALLCIENPVVDFPSPPLSPMSVHPASPSPFMESLQSLPSLQSGLWSKNKNFERLFNALMKFLEPTKSEDVIEYGLIVVWEMLEHQAPCIEGREASIFSVLLSIRYCNKPNVLEATNTIRDALTTRIEPVYGLTTMHASLRSFDNEPLPEQSSGDVKGSTYAFGLSALGRFVLRLPAEILEDELPRMKKTLISALNDKSLVVRESAAALIIAAQLVMRDETHLFVLLDGLADDKKNLLAYLFDKHGARGSMAPSDKTGLDKLQKEMRRLDTRTSTPPRVRVGEV